MKQYINKKRLVEIEMNNYVREINYVVKQNVLFNISNPLIIAPYNVLYFTITRRFSRW